MISTSSSKMVVCCFAYASDNFSSSSDISSSSHLYLVYVLSSDQTVHDSRSDS